MVQDPAGTLGSFAPPAVHIDEAPAQGPSAEELQKLYEDAKAENDRLKAQTDPVGVITQGFQNLQGSLKDLASRPVNVQTQPAAPQVDEFGQVLAEVDANFLEAPGKNMARVAEMAMRRPLDTIISSNFAMAERLVGMTSPDKDLFAEYKDEIRAEFGRLDARERVQDPVSGYERAFDIVKGRHINDIFARRTAASAAAAPAATAAPAPAPAQAAGATQAMRPSPFAPSPTAQGTGEIHITAQQADWVRSRMLQRGIAEADFEAYVEVLVESGELKALRR